MSSTFNQLIRVWNGLDLAFQMLVDEPIPDIMMGQFLAQLDAKSNILFHLANKKSESSKNGEYKSGKSVRFQSNSFQGPSHQNDINQLAANDPLAYFTAAVSMHKLIQASPERFPSTNDPSFADSKVDP